MAQGFKKRLRAWCRRWLKRNVTWLYIKQRKLSPYLKPYRTPQELVAKLQAMGLVVSVPANAEAILTYISYYRFKIYLRPFLNPPDFKAFVVGANFDDACQLHDFDRDLRAMVLSLTGIIEINLRHELDRVVGSYLNDPFWYMRREIYREFPKRTLSHIFSAVSSSSEDFSKHFANKYHNCVGKGRNGLLPPFWMTVETLTLGQLLYLMKALDKKPFEVTSGPNLLDTMANGWGAYNLRSFELWVEYIRNMRNWCAHHNRLWSRNMGIPPGIERLLSPKVAGKLGKKNRIYLNLAMIRVMLKNSGQQDGIAQSMHSLFAKYPVADHMKAQMGFPERWHADPFWI